jgi:hypothetical protein
MGDNEAMTERSTEPQGQNDDSDLEALEITDPADAPQIAEDLADRLAQELDSTNISRPSDPQDPS